MRVRYECTECHDFSAVDMGMVVDHIRRVHDGEPEIKTVDIDFSGHQPKSTPRSNSEQ